MSPLISKPGACKLLAGGRAPAIPPASDPTDTMHPERGARGGHHRKKTFQEELAEMLEKAGVEYDLRYLD